MFLLLLTRFTLTLTLTLTRSFFLSSFLSHVHSASALQLMYVALRVILLLSVHTREPHYTLLVCVCANVCVSLFRVTVLLTHTHSILNIVSMSIWTTSAACHATGTREYFTTSIWRKPRWSSQTVCCVRFEHERRHHPKRCVGVKIEGSSPLWVAINIEYMPPI